MSQESSTPEDHYIVAIGASAGGLEAIHEFFDHMPGNNDLSFVIIQHLSPDHKSLLVELVSRHTNMQVYEAVHDLPIRKNCIYVIPNNKFITVQKNRLILTEKLPLKVPNNAIDVFMYSLAREKHAQAIGVVLSGTGTDGTKGISSIKEEGGLVIAQEPTSSRFDGMPNSAIASGCVDYILPARDIPQQIISHLTEAEWTDDSIDDETLDRIFERIHTLAGFDFHYYKTPTITRRVFHRMKKANFNDVQAYYNFLKDNADECRQLGKDFLINVTRFFRDAEAFEVLRTDVLPNLIKNKTGEDPFKIWVCACSTGEEAYSMAILVDELLEELGLVGMPVKIFATDLERTNIEIASRGIYPHTIESDVSPERLKKYFSRHEGGYTISPRIRKQIVFASHNVIKDPPFIKNDLVSCRNMLIYMNAALQQRVYSVLLFSLRIDGHLFLGTTENPNFIKPYLEELNSRWKVYRKVSDAKLMPYLSHLDGNGKRANGQHPLATRDRVEKRTGGLWDDMKETLMEEFKFAAFYIDRNFEIKEAVGNFEGVLSLPKKILKLNLLRMLPGNISAVLIEEIKTAWKDNDKRIVNDLQLHRSDRDFALQVLVRPAHPHTLVAFHLMQLEPATVTSMVRAGHHDLPHNDYVLSLEEELNETKETLQHAIEDLETANEELQSSNEELLSANEELQSSNEELQSLNEELHTLNTEHQLKIRELIELNDDLNNYFRSSNIGQIFLDKNMVIRKFNPASARMINFIDTDIGRPITHISTNIQHSSLVQDIESVLRTGEIIEKEAQLHNGMTLLLRVMPYITQEQRASGVVISFFDITAVTNLNNIIRGVFNSSLSAIFALECERSPKKEITDFSIAATNHAAAALLKLDADVLKGMLLKKDLKLPFLDSLFQAFTDVVLQDTRLHVDCYVETEGIWLEVTAVKMMDGVVATFTDITQKKTAEERLKKNFAELVTTKEHLKSLNADLETKVIERTRLLSASEERFRLVARATNDALWDWDIVNNQVWFSDAFYLKFDYDQTVPFDRRMWLSKIHPDDQKRVDTSIHQTINSGKKQWSLEYRFCRANGEYAHILDRGYVLQDEYNTPHRMLGSMLDITDLKQAEHEIASNVAHRKFLAESMPVIVWTASATGQVDFVNNQFEVYTGIRYNDALEDGWKAAMHPEDLTRFETQWREAIVYKSDFQLEVRLRLYNGYHHWNILRAKSRKDDTGDIVSWVITTIDIHEQKQLHELLERKVDERTAELVKMNHALEVSNNDLQQFASVASHDLQEPLRKIHLYANLIGDRYGQSLDGASGYLHKIVQSSVRMKSIIHNILNYSKLSADHLGFELTNINDLVREIVEDLEIAIQEKQAQISVDNFPLIDTIPGQIRQVFQNMIGNALKFSRPGVPPHIRITAERIDSKALYARQDPKGQFCRITIQDNGIGFNEKFSQSIFVLFQRLHSKDAYEGTGIGLAIVKKIVDKHQGLIAASGRENEGASFTIILPLHQPQPQ
jgi:two-component system CheB/CheR fusion protein